MAKGHNTVTAKGAAYVAAGSLSATTGAVVGTTAGYPEGTLLGFLIGASVPFTARAVEALCHMLRRGPLSDSTEGPRPLEKVHRPVEHPED